MAPELTFILTLGREVFRHVESSKSHARSITYDVDSAPSITANGCASEGELGQDLLILALPVFSYLLSNGNKRIRFLPVDMSLSYSLTQGERHATACQGQLLALSISSLTRDSSPS
ncbi:hypothetical protein [Rhizobium ruizarguesonis]|uniref:hypothetical protein n=1 Tax=Rhizobium ruizarguesonis TaxID=2081791 RepID=UPI0013C0A012|nr:hypothetical protein [Rhizobium ruizarguesonis]NEJ02595.1 hypothetical protein [Rhizobium ruizarguesonis]NEJ39723.1 hypothetical protein [Rhizobium ruizarguesonis]